MGDSIADIIAKLRALVVQAGEDAATPCQKSRQLLDRFYEIEQLARTGSVLAALECVAGKPR
jgi:hypothetical protein